MTQPADSSTRPVVRDTHEEGFGFLLSKKLRLMNWGKSHLFVEPVRQAFDLAGYVFLVAGLYECVTWTWYFTRKIEPFVAPEGHALAAWMAHLLVCAIPGTMAAAIVIILDREVYVTDMTVQRFKTAIGMFVRMTIIIASIIVLARTFTLWDFRNPISERLYAEAQRAEIVRVASEISDKKKKAQREKPADFDAALQDTLESGAMDEAGGAVAAAEQNLAAAQAALVADSQIVTAALQAVSERQRDVSAILSKPVKEQRGLSAANRDLATARIGLETAQRIKASTQGQVTRVQEALAREQQTQRGAREQARTRRGEAEAVRDEERTKAEAELTQLQDWVYAVSHGGPNDVPVNPKTGKRLQMPVSDDHQQERVLDDLYHARPPRWPAASEEYMAEIQTSFPDLALAGEEIGERERTEAANLRRGYWIDHVLFSIFPFLVILNKIFMPAVLKAYYSTIAQARDGNPEAQRVLRGLDIPWELPATT